MFSKEIILPKEIPGTEESGRLQSVASRQFTLKQCAFVARFSDPKATVLCPIVEL